MSESDGIDEAFEGITRVGMTVAGRVGEQLSRAREQTLRRAQAAEEQQARELQARFDAERAAARAQLAPALNEQWWDTATGRDIERVHETATAWKDHDPAARDAAQTIRDQVQKRYGLDVNSLGADEASVTAALAKAERDREQADKERGTARDENTQAAGLLAEAEREDRDRQQDVTEENQHPEALRDEASIKYDSAERRQELAARLEGIADKEAVQARLSADQDQGTPPSSAVAKGPGRTPKARKTRGVGGPAKLLQKGMTR
ncbi:coiled-coil domain-containing protein [Paenarthrobacter ureafaciens]|uniref:hypothetical protein n=1 Tax=Paenarthrobacter ureafaciens TaxID=37931 RepID=UPI001E722F6F|nr:hypothetical protein [Paenarthrobacter ureafaciens]MEC3853160.1 hypothetical protein [Paenarthrobacter ureafaciens]BCW86506.1 hypothetical protein NicSoilE8_41790 [Arthrobacter sp. NicSoilE8]